MNKKERPILSNLVNSGTLNIEKIQNEVIRPIIKMQNNLLVILFKDYIEQKKIKFTNFSGEKQKEIIKTSLTKDVNFKNILLGCVIGHFTDKELFFYINNTSELKRRIIQIIKQRLQDNNIPYIEEISL